MVVLWLVTGAVSNPAARIVRRIGKYAGTLLEGIAVASSARDARC